MGAQGVQVVLDHVDREALRCRQRREPLDRRALVAREARDPDERAHVAGDGVGVDGGQGGVQHGREPYG